MAARKSMKLGKRDESCEIKERDIRFWKRCAAEPHCIRLLPENQPRTRNEAILRRLASPFDPRSYCDHKGNFMYPARPVSMEINALKETRRNRLDYLQRQTEALKAIVLKESPKPEMDLLAMRERWNKAKLEHGKQSMQLLQGRLPHLDVNGIKKRTKTKLKNQDPHNSIS